VRLCVWPVYLMPYTFTGRLAGYYRTYTSLMPILWPVYLTPDTRAPVTDRPANDERQTSLSISFEYTIGRKRLTSSG